MTVSEAAGLPPAGARVNGAGWPGVRRVEFATSDLLRAREFLDETYGGRLLMSSARGNGTALAVTHVDTGWFAVSDMTLASDLTFATSTDGVNWSTAVAAGQGTGQFTTIPLSGAPVRYLRVTLTASSGSWWRVADVRAYTGARR